MTEQSQWAAARVQREDEPRSHYHASREQRLAELLEHDTFDSFAFSRVRSREEPDYVVTKLRAGVRSS